MNAGRITLELWIAQNYDKACAPKLNTVRAWARDGKLDPPATKDGRSYFVDPDTRYTPVPTKKHRSLVDRIRAAETAQREERRPAR